MGYFSHAVEASDLEAGDHIYTWRKGFIYSHHGIYVGANKVVHFTNDKILCSSGSSMSTLFSSSSASEEEAQLICSDYPGCLTDHGNGVIMSCLNCFLRNGSVRRYQYGVPLFHIFVKIRSGTCTTKKSDPPETVIKRAMRLLEIGFGRYHFFKNNCEDFALYCKTGLLVRGIGGYGGSGQASSLLSAPKCAFRQFGIELGNPFSSSFAVKKAAMCSPLATVVANPVDVAVKVTKLYIDCKVAADIGLRNDATKVDLEDVPAFIEKKLGR